MYTNRFALLAALAGILALSACDSAREIVDSGAGGGACTACHGGTANDSGAPPVDTAGATASPAVGAHTVHVEALVACTVCHGLDAGGEGHTDGVRAEMDFTGLAVADLASPSYDYGTRTCSGVYCHGATRADGTNTAPIWTGGPLGCSSCHGNPPLSVAPHSASTTDCSICHTAVPGPDHLDGDVDVVTVHPAGYATPTAHGPDAIAGIATCQSCHGTDFGGDVGPSCNDCHDDYGWSATALTTNCAFCHGTKDVTTKPTFDFASAPALAAPPEAVDGDPSNPSIGAHQAHLLGESYSSGFACAECHTVPADLDHIADGEAGAEIVFGPLASAGGVTPSYDTGNCTTYCHGETLLGGTAATPSWTATTLACNACHGQPPDTSLHEFHVISEGAACDDCHIGYFAGTGVNLAYHVNAVKDVVFLKAGGAPGETYTHSTGWGDCTGCHTNNANYQVDP